MKTVIEMARTAFACRFSSLPVLAGRIKAFAELVRAEEREACLIIIDNYEIPVGNSRAGEIACEMTYGALKDIHDAITARGTT